MLKLSKIFNAFKTILKAIFLSIGWNTLSVLIGFLQLFLMIGYALISGKQVEHDRILKDGVILFFCSAFISGSIIDYLFAEIRYHKIFEWLFMYFFPGIIICAIVFLYSAILGLNDSIDIDVLLYGTYICCTLTVGHSLIYRSINCYSRGKR